MFALKELNDYVLQSCTVIMRAARITGGCKKFGKLTRMSRLGKLLNAAKAEF